MSTAMNWLHNATAPKQTQADTSGPPSRSTTTYSQRLRDRNAPDTRLSLNQKCIYERRLPGESYITAHIVRLQKGYYDSPVIHEDRISNCRYVAINFVFHPADERHRFISAIIKLSLHDQNVKPDTIIPLPPQIDRRPSAGKESGKQKPKFLRFSPHLLFGMVSPETLDWNFNLAGSLGVTQGPANATISPSGGVKSSYKLFKMMKIQGSTRTLTNWYGHDYDVEDGELVWTLQENVLQKSGLPREFTFVMLLTKGDHSNDVAFEIEIEPVVGSWYGTYPKWWLNRIWYQELYKEPVDLDHELGQKFQPATKEEGFNFAAIEGSFDDFVYLPGTTYSTSDQQILASSTTTAADAAANDKAKKPQQRGAQPMARQITASPAPNTSNDLNIRVFFEGLGQTGLAPLLPFQMTHPQQTRSLPAVQPSSVVSVTTSSAAKPRERPLSELYPPLSPQSERKSGTKPRPISVVQDRSSTPPSAQRTNERRTADTQRPLSGVSDMSGDLYIDRRSPLSHDEVTPPRPSHSLRHSRSRSGLEQEYKTPPKEEARRQSQTSTHRRSASHSISITSSDVRPGISAPSAVPSLPAPQPPISYNAPRKRNSTRTPNVKRLSAILDNSPPDDPRNSVRFASEPLHVEKYLYGQSENQSQAPTHNVRTYQDQNPAGTEQQQNPPAVSKISFPPTSYPLHQAVRDVNNAPTAIPAAPSPPPLDDVDGIIQREVTNYLRMHPDLMSPVPSAYDSSSQALSNGHVSGSGSNGSVNRGSSRSPNQGGVGLGLGRSVSDSGHRRQDGAVAQTRLRSPRRGENEIRNGTVNRNSSSADDTANAEYKRVSGEGSENEGNNAWEYLE